MMSTIIFDGKKAAATRQIALRSQVAKLPKVPKIVSVLFSEDQGSILYTRLKKTAALKAGLRFSQYNFSVAQETGAGINKIKELANDPGVSGIIVQKPTQTIWQKHYLGPYSFDSWWRKLVETVPPTKDIDCLSPTNLEKLRSGKWVILPATVKAVLLVLESALNIKNLSHPQKLPSLVDYQASIIGCSDIIGLPLADVLHYFGLSVTLMCDKVNQNQLRQSDIFISATGAPNVVTGDMIKQDAIVIDVGAPKADVEFDSAVNKASFITPVPGGVGPLTVVSLLENTFELFRIQEPKKVNPN